MLRLIFVLVAFAAGATLGLGNAVYASCFFIWNDIFRPVFFARCSASLALERQTRNSLSSRASESEARGPRPRVHREGWRRWVPAFWRGRHRGRFTAFQARAPRQTVAAVKRFTGRAQSQP